MPTFSGVDHFALTVTDLDVSTRFYRDVLGFLPLLDFGYGRLLMQNPSGFTLGLLTPAGAADGPFSELVTGLDHLGFAAADRDELVAWQQRFDEVGVSYTPITDDALSSHLNFRDPDGIALEFTAPTPMYVGIIDQMKTREVPYEEMLAIAGQVLGPELVAKPSD